MDPRGRETDALVAAGGLSRLSKATGVEFPTIIAARTADDLRKIGLEDDGNKNLTRRMLLLLESRAALGDSVYERVKTGVLNAYLEELEKPYRPPRFLLNDVIRYWRTIAVDFEAKHRNREGEEWGLRNAKLRTSRRLLFAGGLLPVLECHRLRTDEIEPFLQEQFEALPTDRIAACFLRHDRGDSGARTLAAYDAFLAILDDPDTRDSLKGLSYADNESSEVFRRAKRLGGEIRDGLLSLLMETRDLYPLVREYAIF